MYLFGCCRVRNNYWYGYETINYKKTRTIMHVTCRVLHATLCLPWRSRPEGVLRGCDR